MAEKEIIRVAFPNMPKPEEKPIVRKRVGAYARVSTEQDKQENSLRSQKDYFTKYIKAIRNVCSPDSMWMTAFPVYSIIIVTDSGV